MFSLREGGGPLPGAGPPLLRRFLRFQVAALGIFLPICIKWEPRTGLAEGNRTSQTQRLN